MNIAVIVSGGKGTRITSNIPKQFIIVEGKEMLCHTIEQFQQHPLIDEIIIVTLNDYVSYVQNLIFKNRYSKVRKVVVGGETRQESVRNALNSINCNEDDYVLIHDGDRPLVSFDIITKCVKNGEQGKTAVVGLLKSDKINEISNSGREATYQGIDYYIQTPQCFNCNEIKEAHNRLKEKTVSDDASLFDILGKEIYIVQGDKNNFKVTTDIDLEYFKKMVKENGKN